MKKYNHEYETRMQDYDEELTELDDTEYTMGSGVNLSLKERMMILSRRDRMGRAKPTWYRILIVAVVLLVVMTVVQKNRVVSNKNIAGAEVLDGQIQLTFVGDLSLGGGVETLAEAKSYKSLFRQASVLWEDSSFVFANLETPILRQNTVYGEADKAVTVSAPWTALKVASENGVNVVSAANDHIGDYGRKGMEHTLEALNNYGVQYAGAGANMDEAIEYRLLEEGELTVGFIAFSDVVPKRFAATSDRYGIASSSYTELYRQVLEASKYSDFVVVYVHWGSENSLMVTDEQQQIAHQLIDSGANVVIGTHPQVLQPVETYGDGIIFYSLGAFIGDTIQHDERCTVMVQLNVTEQTGEAEFTLIPMYIEDFRPCLTDNAIYTRRIQNTLVDNLEKYEYTIDEDGRIHITMDLYTPGEKSDVVEVSEDNVA